MAYTSKINLDNGLTVPDAYHRISYINGTKEVIEVQVKSYPTREFYLANRSVTPLSIRQYSFKNDVADGSLNLFKQAYIYLLSLAEYEGAVNVPLNGSPD